MCFTKHLFRPFETTPFYLSKIKIILHKFKFWYKMKVDQRLLAYQALEDGWENCKFWIYHEKE